MSWVKRGCIQVPENKLWANGFLTPTPVLLNNDVIRVFVGCWGADNISRLGYIDLAAECPSRVLGYSRAPIIALGEPGCFDDNGMILGDVIQLGDEWRIYYVGFQKALNVKFMAFTGCCTDTGSDPKNFHRISKAPILDRNETGLFIRAVHTVIPTNDGFKVWYSAGNDWREINGNPYPCYEIYYADSPDGITLFNHQKVLGCDDGEYRIGRPRVTRNADGDYLMLFTYDTVHKEYRSGAATSPDGRIWYRDDSLVGIQTSPEGWDSETVCYPVRLNYGSKEYMFYSGNGMGRTGFGYAERVPL